MGINIEKYKFLLEELKGKATLVAVSKTKPIADIEELYNLGQRDFGENYVQELVDKATVLPKDIRWHFIGHLQSNKVKYIAPFVHLIHGVDSLSLLQEINKQALKNNRIIDCLLQIHIAKEETKFGLDAEELQQLLSTVKGDDKYKNVQINGLMGMASFSDDKAVVTNEFKFLRTLYDLNSSKNPVDQTTTNPFSILSMGMSGDYSIAINEGSNMVRIGSLLFGERNTI